MIIMMITWPQFQKAQLRTYQAIWVEVVDTIVCNLKLDHHLQSNSIIDSHRQPSILFKTLQIPFLMEEVIAVLPSKRIILT